MPTKKILTCPCEKQGCWRNERNKIPAYCEANIYLDELERSKEEYPKEGVIDIYKLARNNYLLYAFIQADVNAAYSPIICRIICLDRGLLSKSTRIICCHVPRVSFLSLNGITIEAPRSEART